MPRLLSKGWIAGFLEHTDGIVAPEVMRVWAALSAIAAVLGRRVHTRIQRQDCYPNMYVLFVGPPGVGKSNSAVAALNLIRKVQNVHIAPEAITSRRAFLKELEKAQELGSEANPLVGMHHTLYALVEEMSVFCHPEDREFMNALTRLYDCRAVFEYVSAHVGEHHIENACFNMLACCTRTYIADAWSRMTLEAGFPARIIVVYSDERQKKELFDAQLEPTTELRDALIHDLGEIHRVSGVYQWHPEAGEILSKWYKSGMPPVPGDNRLEHYCNRRLAHTTKLCQIIAASKSDDLIIMPEDVIAAMELLLMAEKTMPQALEILGANPLIAEMTLAVKLVTAEWKRSQAPMPEYKLRQYLVRDVPPQFVNSVIDNIILSRDIKASGDPGRRMLYPVEVEDGKVF